MPLGGLLPYDDTGGLMDFTPEDEQAALRNALLAFGSSALSNSGWSNTPVSLGQAVGPAVAQGASAYESGLQQAVKNALLKRQIAAQDRKTQQEEDEVERLRKAREAASGSVPENLRGAFALDPNTAATAAGLAPSDPDLKFVKDFKLPDGSSVSGYISPQTGFIPISNPVPPEPTVDEKKQVLALRTAQDTLNDLKSTFAKTGTEILPTAGKAKLESQYRNLQLQLKELFNLGVLNGPDLDLMNQVLVDPTSAGANLLYGGTDRVVASMEEVQRFIQNKEKALLQSPGVRAREGDSIIERPETGNVGESVNWSDL